MVVLAAVYVILGKEINILRWLELVLGVQGSVVGVPGADQTWFISVILLCYLATPVIDKLVRWGDRRKNVLASVLICLPLIFSLFPPAAVSTIVSPVAWYALAYLLGMNFAQIKFSRCRGLVAVGIMCGAFAIRILGRFLCDGTILYDRIIAGYTHYLAAFCILYLFAWVFKERKPPKIVGLISDISFEIYLYQCMFIGGPLQIFGKTVSWVTDCVLVTVITVALSYAMNKVSNCVVTMLSAAGREKIEGRK